MKRENVVPLILSVALHALLVFLLVFHFDLSVETPEVKPQPRIIQAKLLSMNANPVARVKKVEKRAEDASAPEEPPPPPPKQEEPKPEPVKPVEPPKPEPKPEPDKTKLLKLKQAEEAKKKAAEEKAKAEAKKKEEQKKLEETKKAEAAKKKSEAEKQEKARKEKERQDALRKQREKAAREELSKMLSEDEEAESTNTEGQLVQSYEGAIKEAIERRWSRPPSARNGMSCQVLIEVIPTGEVVNVQIVKSSGDDAFDRSAVNAVKKASPFTELQALKGGPEFERNFRRFTLPFIAEGLRQ